eukprot:scaffold46993_cov21-Cyclotella_meneghiniana.AAC.2
MENNAKISFPEKLYEIVSDPSVNDIIRWLPHGRGFLIHKTRFAIEILPKHFEGIVFNRLKRWSFTRIASGAELDAYYHPNFTRDEPSRVKIMEYPGHEGSPAPLTDYDANTPSESIHQSPSTGEDDSANSVKKSVKSFAEKLYEIVSDPSVDDIISWNPHGQGFLI